VRILSNHKLTEMLNEQFTDGLGVGKRATKRRIVNAIRNEAEDAINSYGPEYATRLFELAKRLEELI
jgi:hypothetical protein